jgi:citrate lyase gamma subunit
VELRGNLIDFSLPDIIQLVGFGRKTGALRLDCSEGSAALFFDQGNVVHAECSGSVGEEAVYHLFRVPEGEFRFQTEVLPDQRTIAMDPTNLIMEAARQLDESRRDDAEELVLGDDFETSDWFGEQQEPRDTQDIKAEIKTLLKDRFGRGARKLLQAVDRCGDSVEELNDMADRAEKYIQVFLDSNASQEVGRQVRQLISRSS